MTELKNMLVDYYLPQVPLLLISFPFLLLPFAILERWRPVGTPPNWRDYLFNFSISASTAIIAGPFGMLACVSKRGHPQDRILANNCN